MPELRSRTVTHGRNMAGARALMRASGVPGADIGRKPVIAVANSFTELLQQSQARKRFEARPEALMQHETCVGCDYLSICHGGCPVRTYSITGDFFVKDPYCQVYKSLFSCLEEKAAQVASRRYQRALPVLRARS